MEQLVNHLDQPRLESRVEVGGQPHRSLSSSGSQRFMPSFEMTASRKLTTI
jgi:hypothetical protein